MFLSRIFHNDLDFHLNQFIVIFYPSLTARGLLALVALNSSCPLHKRTTLLVYFHFMLSHGSSLFLLLSVLSNLHRLLLRGPFVFSCRSCRYNLCEILRSKVSHVICLLNFAKFWSAGQTEIFTFLKIKYTIMNSEYQI